MTDGQVWLVVIHRATMAVMDVRLETRGKGTCS